MIKGAKYPQYLLKSIFIVKGKNYFLKMQRFRIVLYIFLFSLILRLLFILYANNFVNPEMSEFGIIANNLLTGKGYACFAINGKTLPSAYMPPAYPIFLTFIFKIIGQNSATFFLIQCIQAILQAGLCVMVYLISKRTFKRQKVAIISALIVSIYPALIYVVTRISAFPFYSTVGITLFLLLIKSVQEQRIRDMLLSSACMGLLILFRLEDLIYVPPLMVWLFFNLEEKKRIKFILTFFLGTVLIVTPWVSRNYIVFHKFVFGTTSFGYNLYRGNNPELKISGVSPIINSHMEQQIKDIPLNNNYEIERDRIFLKETIEFLKNNSKKIPLLMLKKAFIFWTFDFTYTGKIAHMYGKFRKGAQSLFYVIPWLFILPFFIIGLWSSFSDPRRYTLFYLFIVLQTAIVMLFFVLPRYRLFIEPLIIIIASQGLVQSYERIILTIWRK